MNETAAMLTAGKIALRYRQNLLNMLCRKCRQKAVNAVVVRDKSEAATLTDKAVKDQLSNKTLTKMYCKICQSRFDKIAKEWS